MISVEKKIAPIREDWLLTDEIYWLNQLSGDLPETNLITDYVRPVRDSGKNKQVSFELPKDSYEAIAQFAKTEFSLYLFLLAALKILLLKYIGNNDVIVGTPNYRPGRSDRLTNHNIVPLRSTVSDRLTFHEFFLQVQDTAIAAYSHANYSLDDLVQLLNISPTQNRCPIFDLVVLLENIHSQTTLEKLSNDLTVSFRLTENKIQGKIQYKSSLFKDETIERMTAHYIHLIGAVIQNIHIQISEICLLTESEKRQLLESFNDKTRHYPVDRTIHQLFEKQVEQTPNKIAVEFESTQLTYRELNQKANQLARLLQKLGLKKGEFVGIFNQRDQNYPLAILAILKAGGAYVPMDTTYPPERIKYMLSNSEVRILLTHSSFLNLLTDGLKDCPNLNYLTCLDVKPKNSIFALPPGLDICDRLDFDKFTTENLGESDGGTTPAYMMYTSGSTGLPKGAIIRHGGAINHIYAQFDALEWTENFTFLQSAPASSDISVWQFLAPLLIGGKTVIVDTETVCNPEKLFAIVQQKKLTLVELVPVVLRGLLDYISSLSTQQTALPDLKWMMVTGEYVSVELVNRWLRTYPSIPVANAYGPTEAADDITQAIIQVPLPENQRTVPIGKPLANLNLYILDSQMNLVPIGVPGEICVSGFGVGQGYWKNERSTGLNFVPNPFPNATKPLPGTERDFIYKTGDLGRWLPDGTIEFLGRIDEQVKIRGFRIELGEIEALLEQHPAVRETVVILREDSLGNKRLVAYVVPKELPVGAIARDLRLFLRQRLPYYMVPNAFAILEALPLLPNGKIDRRALPAPNDTSESELLATFVAPATPVEEVVAGILGETLAVEKVGIYDNFFDLGGHSLVAFQFISRLRDLLGVELPLSSLFETSTVAGISTAILQKDIDSVKVERMAPLLLFVAGLSDSEVEKMLAQKMALSK